MLADNDHGWLFGRVAQQHLDRIDRPALAVGANMDDLNMFAQEVGQPAGAGILVGARARVGASAVPRVFVRIDTAVSGLRRQCLRFRACFRGGLRVGIARGRLRLRRLITDIGRKVHAVGKPGRRLRRSLRAHSDPLAGVVGEIRLHRLGQQRLLVTPILDKEIGERDSRTTRDVIQGRIVASSITRVIPLMSFCNTAIFCCLDDFAQTFEDWEHHNLIPTGRKRRRSGKLCLGEMLFIMVLFHLSPFKDFKHFWHYGVEQKYRNYFGDIPSYGRFVSLMPRLFIPFCVLMHSLTGDQTGLYVADSTKIAVCHNLRISRNRVFADLAKRGKTTTGWFYGFKLHVIINHKGEIMAIKITPGNTDDRSVLDDMTRELEGKVLADKGYISKELFAKLWRRGLHLITGIRRNMKNYLMPLLDKLLLRKRFIIETLFDRLKSQMGLEHTRHRSPINAFVHILSCLAAYTLGKTKVSMSAVR